MKNVMYGILLAGLLSSACRNEGFMEETSPTENLAVADADSADAKPKEFAGELLGQVILDSVAYSIPREKLLQPFIREFGDGTVIDRVSIQKIQDDKRVKPTYYLVGTGLYNGNFRAMAFELQTSSDNSLYLRKQSTKHIAKGSKCGMCYFTFASNSINGVECENGNSSDGFCDYTTENSNEMFAYKVAD